MKKITVLLLLASCLFAFTRIPKHKTDPEAIAAAIRKSLVILQKSSHEFLDNADCFSCHGQCLSNIAFAMADRKGFAMVDSLKNESKQFILNTLKRQGASLAEHTDPSGANITTGYVLWGFKESNTPSNKPIVLLVNQLLDKQKTQGYWPGGNGRPPLEYYSFSATALSLKGILSYAPESFHDRVEKAKKLATNWLINTKPVTNEEKVFQLLGLTWIKGDSSFIMKQAQQLLHEQHADGGWSQLDSLPTDSYATGQCLYALQKSGALQVEDDSYQRGIQFLLSTQHKDGSWRVISRSHPALPYVYSGFPYGGDQFISAAGTNWACIALLLAVK
jgi:squalene cyclase